MSYIYESINLDQKLGIKFREIQYNGRQCPKHWHNSLELIFVTNGKLEFYINGSIKNLNSGDLLVVNPRYVHSHLCKDSNTTALLLQIPYEFLNANIDNIGNIIFEVPSVLSSTEILSKTNIEHCMEKICFYYYNRSKGYSLKIKGYVYQILFNLIDNFSSYNEKFNFQKSEVYLDRLELITKYVKEHYKEDISLDTISRKVNLNPEYFSRFFKKYMGTTFLKYLNTIRLDHAYIELLNTDYSISTIADNNGFKNSKFFVKTFKDFYSCTPSEMRKKSSISLVEAKPIVSNCNLTFQQLYCKNIL